MMRKILQKLHHEKWPTPLFYTPVAAYYLYTSLRLRKFNYFTSVNPSMKTGGLCGFSKYDSFKNIPQKFLPETLFIKAGSNIKEYQYLDFPKILKPDQGERGLLVTKVDSFSEMSAVVKAHPNIDFLIQEFISYPLELGVFLIKDRSGWSISSITAKKFLSLTGDGFSSLKDLALKDERAKDFLHKVLDPDKVLPKGETILLEPIGNHSRGTEFVNACHHISPDLISSFKVFLDSLEGVNYCRLDLKTASWADLEDGKFKVMEINGVSAEPGHIYDPNMSLKQAYKDLFHHWKSMARIAEENLEEGETFKETFTTVKDHMRKKKRILQKSQNVKKLVKKTNKQDSSLNFANIVSELKVSESPQDILEGLLKVLPINEYKKFDSKAHHRVVLHSDDKCELVLCCWSAKQCTESHGHDGRKCIFRCVEGQLSEKRESCEAVKYNPGEWGEIDDSMGEHEMFNLSESETISLHFYQDL